MARTTTSRWEEIRERRLADPQMRERYERTRRTVTQTREMLRRIEAEREAAGVSKAELARRLGANASTVRRVLTSASANPTLRTMLDVLDVLGLEVSLQSKRRAAATAETTARPPT